MPDFETSGGENVIAPARKNVGRSHVQSLYCSNERLSRCENELAAIRARAANWAIMPSFAHCWMVKCLIIRDYSHPE